MKDSIKNEVILISSNYANFNFSGEEKKTGWPESQVGIEANNIYNKRKQNNGNLQDS